MAAKLRHYGHVQIAARAHRTPRTVSRAGERVHDTSRAAINEAADVLGYPRPVEPDASIAEEQR